MRIDLSQLISVSKYFSLKLLESLTVVASLIPIFYSSLKHKMNFDDPSKAVVQLLVFTVYLLMLFHIFQLKLQTF